MNALRVPPPLLSPPGRRDPTGIRLTPSRVHPRVAHLSLTTNPSLWPPALDALELCLGHLRRAGFEGAITAALTPRDQLVFHKVGFRVVERLHLLRRSLAIPVPKARPRKSTRRAKRRDHEAILAVDQAAFVPFWRIDTRTLAEAIAATQHARLRVAEGPDGDVAGYAVCGRSGAKGYVQRLAVHPDHQGQGLGRALLADGLAWLARWGARDALVNTQIDNERSLDLYRRAGFQVQPEGLAVLRIDFPDGRPGI